MTYNKQVYKILLVSFIGFILCLILAVICQSEPFIRSAPQHKFMNDAGVMFFEISYDNGQTWKTAEHIEVPPDQIQLMQSLSDLSLGEHIISVRAVNPWGMSNASPLEFTKGLPQLPTNIELVFEEFEIVDIIP